MAKKKDRLQRIIKGPKIRLLISGILITLFVLFMYVFKPSYLNMLELKLYDTVLWQTHSSKTTGAVAVVDIDEKSLEKFGQWPWPRYRVALLLQKIKQAGAIAVGLDMLFAEPDGTSPMVLKKALKRDLQVDIGFSGMPDALMDNDRVLAGVLNKGPYVLGYSANFESTALEMERDSTAPLLKAIEIKDRQALPAAAYLFQAKSLISPLPSLLAKAPGAGFMNTITDKDGVLRRTPLFLSWEGRLYPQLALATLMTAFKDRIPDDPVIKVNKGGIEWLKFGNLIIPLEANGGMMINFRGPGKTFPYYSAGDILDDKLDSSKLAGKIIFLGTSASGLKDIRVSPFDQVYPGVEVHATMVDNILSNDFILRPDWTPGLEFGLILVWGLFTALLVGWAGSILTLPVSLLLGLAAWYGSFFTFQYFKIWVSPFFPLLVLVVNFSILNLIKFRISEKKKKFYRSAFSKYVSKAVVDQLAQNPGKLSLEGEEKQISILFSDIRGFTSISEQLTPTQVTELLNDYFTPVTQIIIKNQGTHDKFIGDAIMSFWNAPLDVPDHERFAVNSALKIIRMLKTLNREFKQRFNVELSIGIGLHSGKCRVGNMGSKDIFEYTIIGDSVNLASRLEGLTKFYGVPLIVSESMLKGVTDDMKALEVDIVKVKGKDKPVKIYTILPEKEPASAGEQTPEERYESALVLYKQKDFTAALQRFELLSQSNPDTRLYEIYADRCRHFRDNPPDEYWDGVFTHTSK